MRLTIEMHTTDSPTCAGLHGPATGGDSLAQLRAAGLTGRQVECLSLYYFDGLSQSQIGRRLGVGQRTVSQHLEYGRRKLAAVRLRCKPPIVQPPRRMQQVDMDVLDNLAPQFTRGLW